MTAKEWKLSLAPSERTETLRAIISDLADRERECEDMLITLNRLNEEAEQLTANNAAAEATIEELKEAGEEMITEIDNKASWDKVGGAYLKLKIALAKLGGK